MGVFRLAVVFSLMFWSVSAKASEGCDPGEIVIKFSHVTNAVDHPKGIAASKLAARINSEMDGLACMRVYSDSSLYDDQQVFEALLHGDVQLAAPSLSKFERYTKRFRIFDLPFLFPDIEAVDRFQNSEVGEQFKDSLRNRGLKGLAFWHNGMKQMSASKPLLHPRDASGLKFRIQTSTILEAQFRALGALAQRMPLKDVYPALRTGLIDGQENTWSNIYGLNLYKVQNGITETNHGVLDYLVVTSDEWWTGLPHHIRDPLYNILMEVTRDANIKSAEINKQNKKQIQLQGGIVRTLTPQQRAAWVEALRPVWDEFELEIGTDLIRHALELSRVRTTN